MTSGGLLRWYITRLYERNARKCREKDRIAVWIQFQTRKKMIVPLSKNNANLKSGRVD